MRVLVTGASGMLGRALASALAERGDEVTVAQRSSSGLDCRELRGDLADPAVAAAAVTHQDAVVHLAAKVDVAGQWASYYRINVEGTRNLLDSARRAGVGRFVQVSSPSVAHTGRSLFGAGAEEANPRATRSHYARTKAIAERIALKSDAAGFAVTAIRPHLVWGPGDTQLVGRILERARSGRLALIGGGAALIDTTYLDNAVDALAAAVERCEQVHGMALVVTNGQPRPVAEIVASLCSAAGVRPPRWSIPYRAAWLAGAGVEAVWAVRARSGHVGDPPMTRFLAEQLATAHWFDQRETRERLDWKPNVDLDEGFARLAASFDTATSVRL